MSRKILVTGVTGAQGRAIAEAFQEAGHAVFGLSRKGGAGEGFAAVKADYEDRVGLAAALEGADVLAITSPIDHRPQARQTLVRALVDAAARAGVKRIVLNTAASVPDDLDKPVAAVLREVREIVRSGAVPAVVIQPTVYLDNLAAPWARAAIAGQGVLAYPAPIGAAVSWISHRTLGQAAVAAAERGEAGSIYDIGGPASLTGPELADVITQATGRPVTYVEMPLDAFASGINAALGAPAGDDIADFYRYLRDKPDSLRRNPAVLAGLGAEAESAAAWASRQTWAVAA